MRRVPCLFVAALLVACAVNPVPTPATTQAAGAAADAAPAEDDQANKAGGDAALSGPQDAAAAADGTQVDVAGKDAAPLGVMGAPLAVTATDPGSDPKFGDHFAAAKTDTLGTGKLVVFLPGTSAQPKHYLDLALHAAGLGHRVLVLAYPNQPSLFELCGEDGNCYEFVRHEILDGQDRSQKVAIKPTDCIQNRLVKALQYLDKQRPGQGWGSFTSGSTPVWSKIVAAGHSQGAGHAAFIAKLQKVARVAMFAGVVDGTAKGPAAWVNNQHATAASAYFGFVHAADPAYAHTTANWTALGMETASVDVDATKPPWTTGQRFVATASSDNPHGVVATSKGYAPVWTAVVGP